MTISSFQIYRRRRPRRALSSCTYRFCLEGILFTSLLIASCSFSPTVFFKYIQQKQHMLVTTSTSLQNSLLTENIQSRFTSSTTASSNVSNPPPWTMIFDHPKHIGSIRRNNRHSKFGIIITPQGQSTSLSMTHMPTTRSILGFDIENTLIESSSTLHKSSRASTLDHTSTSSELLQEGQYLSNTMKIKNDLKTWRSNSTTTRHSSQRMMSRRPTTTQIRFGSFSPIKKRYTSGGGFSNQRELKTKTNIPTMKVLLTPQRDNYPQQSPLWLPYLPTQSQIQELRWVELKAACQERGLSTVRYIYLFFPFLVG